ncbi:MAG: GntR family transcriptional regulator [Planctomycetota bacterium]|nr:GntR family transcriptional regulator [Planctomycetota bacterium]
MKATLAGRQSRTDQAAVRLRSQLSQGRVEPGAFLPAERELSARLGVSRVTARRALAQLVDEGLLEAVPHQGHRVRASKHEDSGGALAYVLASAESDAAWDFTHEQLLAAFHRVLLDENRPALALGAKGRGAAELLAELKARGAWGVALDSSRADLAEAFAVSGMPCVVVDAYVEHPALDVVLQDNFNGARQAAAWLAARGPRVAWLGPRVGFAHYRERYAGALAGLAEAGIEPAPENLAVLPSHDDAEAAATWVREAFARPANRRPTGLLCMWQALGHAVLEALRACGIKPGRDVELVGWATEREYRERWAPAFLDSGAGTVPATIVWRPEDLARLTLSRLKARAADPRLPACRIDVKTRLIEPRPAVRAVRDGA